MKNPKSVKIRAQSVKSVELFSVHFADGNRDDYHSSHLRKKTICENPCSIRDIRGTIPLLRENPSNLRVSASPLSKDYLALLKRPTTSITIAIVSSSQ